MLAPARHSPRLTELELERVSLPAGADRWRGRSLKRDINVVLNAALPMLLIVSFVTGWIASLMGLTEFGLHKYSSIAVFVVALAHLVLHWRAFVTQMRRISGGSQPRPTGRPQLRVIRSDDEFCFSSKEKAG
jgi:hypothetical protein